MTTYDTIIIGAGHNGLIAATLLAKSGKQTLVLEQNDTSAQWVGNPETSLLRPQVLQALGVSPQWVEPDCTALALAPWSTPLRLSADPQESARAIAEFSAADAEAYPKFVSYLAGLAQELEGVLTKRVTLGDQGILLTKHPELVRFVNTPLRETLDFWFENARVKGAIAALALEGLNEGPYQQGVGFNLLYRWNLGGWRRLRYAQGGMSALLQTLKQAAQTAGAQIRPNSTVQQILLQNDTAIGVRLADGTEILASRILSTIDPKATYFGLLPAGNLPPSAVRQLKNYKMRGSTSRILLELSHLPDFGQSHADDLAGQVLFAPNMETLERSFDANKFGELPETPYLRIYFGGAQAGFANALADHAGIVASVEVRYTPYRLSNGNWDDRRADLERLVLKTLDQLDPNFSQLIQKITTITPLDLEREYGLTEGCTEQGQMLLEQCFALRPIPALANGNSPIAGLGLAGAGAHPGGGLTGLPGWLWSAEPA